MLKEINSNDYSNDQERKLRIKLRSGASIINVKPLFTYDSKCIIVASGTDLKVFSIASGECVQTLRKHETQIVSIQPNINNHLQIISCSEDGTLIRWDFMEGQALEVYRLEGKTVAAFYAPTSKNWFVSAKSQSKAYYQLFSFEANNSTVSHMDIVIKSVHPKENMVAFGVECKFIAAVEGTCLRVFDWLQGKSMLHLNGKLCFTCVACHPTECFIATGDEYGRIILWSDIFLTRPVKSMYHWHTLPVADLVFSSEGSYLFSGGGEAALVKWHLNVEERKILPRLGLPIHQLAASKNNDYILTAHQDNAIQVINSVFQVIQIIQGLTQGHFQGKLKDGATMSTGMLYDSRLQALVMNGKPGHLQFYKIHEDRQLFNLDIVGRNIISQERDSVVSNLDVWKTAIDDKGHWLATVEYWNNGEMSPEIRLKFWEFDEQKQTYVLNTFVFLPHNKEINYIGFQPQTDDPDASPLVVTTSADGKFKLWSLSDESPASKTERWSCESVGYYRGLPAGGACFSEDGSLLAVAFGPVATVWTSDSVTLKARFCLPHSDKSIRQIMFGNGSCTHLLVSSSSSGITVWNLLTLTTLLTIQCELQVLIKDRNSEIFAAFCDTQNLFIFKPDNPKPIYFMKDTSKKPIIAGIFVPIPQLTQDKSPSWHKNSELFFLNEDQILLNITDEPEEDENVNVSKLNVDKNIPLTPFGMLQAEHTKTNVKTDVTKKHTIKNKTERDFTMTDVFCPTNQNAIALCSIIFPSLLIPAKKKKDVKNGESSSSQDETKVKPIYEPMEVEESLTKTRKTELPRDFIGITDFSFLEDLVEFSREK